VIKGFGKPHAAFLPWIKGRPRQRSPQRGGSNTSGAKALISPIIYGPTKVVP
jgi:hypothetical protein